MDCLTKWDEMPWEEVKDGIYRKVVMGDRMMMVMYLFPPNLDWPEEQHEAEQGGYVVKGKAVLRLPGEGREGVLGPGDSYLIPSMKRHSWKILDEETILLDFFSPPRKELMEEKYAPSAVNR
jgi:quercetin dioxygenase-like cupin family protein